jgi:hypothetical protein
MESWLLGGLLFSLDSVCFLKLELKEFVPAENWENVHIHGCIMYM